MSAEDELPEEEEEVEEYEPRPAMMGDGDVFIDDPVELLETLGGLAFQVREFGLFVLKKDTMKWINVEDALKPARPTIVAAVPKRQQ